MRVAVDNTYRSPCLQQPLALGADIVLHSATSDPGGHGDLTAGAAVFRDADLAQRVRMQGLKDMTGAVLPAQDAHLVLRGLKTLALRMQLQCENAQAIADLIAAHRAATVVHFSGLRSFPQHHLAPADAAARRHDCVRTERRTRSGPAVHGCAAAVHPRSEPGRCRIARAASGRHDALDIHA